MSEKIKDNWPSFDLNSWKDIKVMKGKIATEEDAKNGSAVFYLKNVGESHKAFEIQLPKLAFLNGEENDSKELVVVIQVESTDKGEVAGYRNPNGGNGACFLYELTFLNEIEIENLIN